MVINFNGELTDATLHVLHHSNRLFRYGDGIFESMVLFDDEVKHASMHQDRLAIGSEILALHFPKQFEGAGFLHEIRKLTTANNLLQARIRVTLYRNSSGFYTPETNESGFIIEAIKIPNHRYEWLETGLTISLYHEIKKPVNQLSSIKTCNALLYVKAGIYCKKNSFDECVLLNESNALCESVSSNIFWIKNSIVYTPASNSGCIVGVMRRHILNILNAANFDVREVLLPFDALKDADEVFLTNVAGGIRWVNQLTYNGETVNYTNTITKKIFSLVSTA